jgi:hypothetical protein
VTYDHEATRIHRAELDREIDGLRTERLLAGETAQPGVVARARRRTGNALIAAGRTLAGPDRPSLGARHA